MTMRNDRTLDGVVALWLIVLATLCPAPISARSLEGSTAAARQLMQLPHIYVEPGSGNVGMLPSPQTLIQVLASKGPQALMKQVALTTHGCNAAALEPGTYCLRVDRDPEGELSAKYTFAYNLPSEEGSNDAALGYSTLIAGPDAINVTANPKAKGVNIDVELGGQQCSTFPSQHARAEGTGEKQDEACASLQDNFPSGVNLTAGGITTFSDCIGGVKGDDKWGINRGNGTRCTYYQAVYGSPLYGWGRDQWNNTGLGRVTQLGVVLDEEPLAVSQTLNKIGEDWIADGHTKP